MATDHYAAMAARYDLMVDWSARIAREQPFFAMLFRERGVRRVLDVGCATGHHSRLFAALGAEVVGLDPSAPMLAKARELTPGGNPRFVEGGFADVPSLAERFDLVTVLGNTLAHVRDADGLAVAVRDLKAVLAPGGALCVQVINYNSLLTETARMLPLAHREADGREYLFLREHRIIDGRAEFTIITLVKEHGAWTREVERSEHVPLTSSLLDRTLRAAGFTQIASYGSYAHDPFVPASSGSLIVLVEG